MCHRFRLDERLSLARFRPAGEVLHQTALLAGCLPRLSHETHRGRVLCCPFATARLVRALPRLRLTADFSHWVVKSERLLDTPAEVELLREVIAPAVDHIHARIGTPQAPQVSDIGAMHCAGAAERHYSFWEDVWAARESASLSARDGEVRDLPPPRLVRPTNAFCTTRPPARPPIHPSAHRQRLKAQGSDVTTDDSVTTVRPTCFAARHQAAGSRPPPPPPPLPMQVTATIEYGPVEFSAAGEYCGYTPIDTHCAPVAAASHHETLAEAATGIRERFASWHADAAIRRNM